MMLGSVYASGHSDNSMFREDNPAHRFYPTHTYRALRDEFAKHGIEINTADVNADRQIDFELHFEGRSLPPSSSPRFLIALENPFINPLNADNDYFENFRRVFTWDRRFLGLPRVQEIAYGNQFTASDWPGFEERDIFSCLINANKRFKTALPNDLYVERVEVIRWYERHAPEDLHLYGLGWDKPRHESSVTGRLKRRAQRIATQLWGYRPFPSWKGELPEKAAVLLKARFSYCYENVYGLTGYVTEKIFDSFANGCVPVYWGADDIADHVPTECFIDRRDFKDTSQVHAFLRAMRPSEYEERQAAIRRFLNSQAAWKFSSEGFAQTIVEGVLLEIAVADRSPVMKDR